MNVILYTSNKITIFPLERNNLQNTSKVKLLRKITLLSLVESIRYL